MALEGNYDTKTGITDDKCYVKIGNINSYYNEGINIEARIYLYYNKTARDECKKPMEIVTINYVSGCDVGRAEVYEYIKNNIVQNIDFSGFMDV